MQRKVNVVEDLKGNRIVIIHDVIFQGKRSVEWVDVEQYLKRFAGEEYTIEETGDLIYIGADLPELIEIATEKAHKDNYKEKHNKDAKYGWYKYTSRFALPVYDSDGEIDRYNVFQVIMIVRHAEDEKMYLYDIMNIKKETSNLFQS